MHDERLRDTFCIQKQIRLTCQGASYRVSVSEHESILHHAKHNICMMKGCVIRFASKNKYDWHVRGRHIETTNGISKTEKARIRGIFEKFAQIIHYCVICRKFTTLEEFYRHRSKGTKKCHANMSYWLNNDETALI